MPISNTRNDQQSSMLSGDFAKNGNHILSYAQLPALIRTMFGARSVLFFGKHFDNSSAYPTVNDEIPLLQWYVTTATGAIGPLISPGQIFSRNGWGGVVRLGEINSRAMYTNDHATYDMSMTEGEVYAPQRGFSGFAGVLLTPNFVDPTGTNGDVVMAKWDFTRVANQRSWMFDYYANSGAPNWRFALSTDGGNTNIQTWMSSDTSQRIVTGSSEYKGLFCGFSCKPGSGGGVYFYINDSWVFEDTPLFDGVGTGYPTSIFNSQAYPTLARREDSTSPYPFHDGYWVFACMIGTLVEPVYARALYELVKPLLFANADFA